MRYHDLEDLLVNNPELAETIISKRDDFSRLLKKVRRANKPLSTVIFLDIDEVIQTRRAQLQGLSIDPTSVKFIKMVLEEFNAKIVICSTWRTFTDNVLTAGKMIEAFGFSSSDCYYNKESLNDEVSFRTNNKGHSREEQIKDWLKAHPHITNFVIIDDSFSQFKDFADKNVAPDPLEGFGVRDYYRCRYVLSNYDKRFLNETLPFKSQGISRNMKTYLEELNEKTNNAKERN